MSAGVVIRDGLETDVPGCMAIETEIETDYVWKIQMREDGRQRHLTFVTDHLPRTMTVHHQLSEERITRLLSADQCFLIAADRTQADLLGFLTMQADHIRKVGWIHDVVVEPAVRRHGIGRRLLKVAGQWAQEHHLASLMAVTQTKNYPSILFCQKNGLAFCGFNDQYFTNQDIALFFSKPVR